MSFLNTLAENGPYVAAFMKCPVFPQNLHLEYLAQLKLSISF